MSESISAILKQPFGERPFKTVVDFMGMGDHIGKYNEHLHQVTSGIYTAFGDQGMLELKK